MAVNRIYNFSAGPAVLPVVIGVHCCVPPPRDDTALLTDRQESRISAQKSTNVLLLSQHSNGCCPSAGQTGRGRLLAGHPDAAVVGSIGSGRRP